MQTRTLGRTGLTVTRIGLGLAALGRPGYINLGHAADLGRNYEVAAMQEHSHAVLDAAWEAGVRYFDAARSYGRAELFLRTWLQSREVAPDAVTVGSKWGYAYTAEWQVEAEHHEIKEHSLPVLKRQMGESWGILGGYLKLYQVHSATLASGILDARDVLEALAALKAEGIAVGLTLSGEGQAEVLRRAMEVEVDGLPVFDCVQATWNLLERSAEEALSEAHAAGMGVIVKEALANGRLTERNDSFDFQVQLAMIKKAAIEQGVGVDALALAAVLARPWADVVLSGAARVEHVRSNLAVAQIAWDEGLEKRLAVLVEAPDDYWGTRAGLNWN